MAKAMPKWMRDACGTAEWKTDFDNGAVAQFSKEIFTLEVSPSINHTYRVSITKKAKMSVVNTMLLDSEQLTALIRNPVVHY